MRQANPDVFKTRHAAIDSGLLERAQNAKPRNGLYTKASNVAGLEAYRSSVEDVMTDDGVEQGRFAGTVRPDQANDLAWLDVKRYQIVCRHTPKVFRDIAKVQLGHCNLDRLALRRPLSMVNRGPVRQAATAGRDSNCLVAVCVEMRDRFACDLGLPPRTRWIIRGL